MRILAVDDDNDILEVLQFILEDSGYDVETLTDGNFLFEKISANRPDLILLDVMLGKLDGRELCRNIKSMAETNHIPVILISASHSAANIYLNNNRSPNAFIPKPFDINLLLNTIKIQIAAA